MKLNRNQMAAIVPSSFGMPAVGHVCVSAFDASATFAGSFAGTGVSVRDRGIATTGDMGLAAYVPGTSAWSPPLS